MQNNINIKQHTLQHRNLLGLYGRIPGEFSANLSGWYPASQQVLLLKARPSCTLQKQVLQSALEIQAAATNRVPPQVVYINSNL